MHGVKNRAQQGQAVPGIHRQIAGEADQAHPRHAQQRRQHVVPVRPDAGEGPVQKAFAGLYAWIGGALTESFPAQALTKPEVLLPLAYLAVMATTVALLFQNVGQVWSDPASASVILSLESVFGVLCSVLFAGDQVSGRMLAGFALIFVAVVCSETKFSFLRKNS